jgi:hypothetical protein
MKLIKLTLRNSSDVYININQIGHFYKNDTDSTEWNTRIGILGPNDNWFKVKETPKEIIAMINKIENKRNGGRALLTD